MANSKIDYMVSKTEGEPTLHKLRATGGTVFQSVQESHGRAKKPNASVQGEEPESDKKRSLLDGEKEVQIDAQTIDSAMSIMSSSGNRTSLVGIPEIPAFPYRTSPPVGIGDSLTLSAPGLQALDGETFRPTSLADPFLNSVWGHLSRSEEKEQDVSLRDDLRIAKLCILEVLAGNPDPWHLAFWKYLGINYEKYLGILAEREAFARRLGKTLTQELEDPAFLKSLDAVARPFYADLQMKLDFRAPISQFPKPVPSPKKVKRTA